MYQSTNLYIDGMWVSGSAKETIQVTNPATGDVIGHVDSATRDDLDQALEAAESGFRLWRATSAYERCNIIRAAAVLIRARTEEIAVLLTTEQGKPLHEARLELSLSADILDWCAEEGRRAYGREIPSRSVDVRQLVLREPIGPVAAFTPWNFPVSQLVRKLGAALAAGCSIIVKAAEETPASAAAVVQAFHDSGLPAGVINLVFGVPADISAYLIPHPTIRKVSFTGSVPVGKHLASLAGAHMKPATMELGGHAPVFVFDDADIAATATTLAVSKFRNAGQVCVSPTRFLIQEGVYDEFLDRFAESARSIEVGNGLDVETRMGPLINDKRLRAIETLVTDAVEQGGEIIAGGRRTGNKGSFYEPTIIAGATAGMRAMNEEPFGPVALVRPFDTIDAAIEEANRLPYGLASYAFSRSARNVHSLTSQVSVGMMSINHLGLALPETHFGGVHDSGHGSEGGPEAVEAYLVAKFVTHNLMA